MHHGRKSRKEPGGRNWSRIMEELEAVHSPLSSTASLVLSSWLGFQCQVWYPSCWADLKAKQRTVGCCQGMSSATVPLGLNHYAVLVVVVVCGWHSQVVQLVLPALEAWIALSDTTEGRPPGGGFQIISSSDPSKIWEENCRLNGKGRCLADNYIFLDLRRETQLKSHEEKIRMAFRICRQGCGIVHGSSYWCMNSLKSWE